MDRAISEQEGHFIAGFIEGEGHLGIAEANGGQSFRCLISLRVRDDDVELMKWLRARTGVGQLRAVPAQAASKPQVEWLVQTQAGCRTLVELLTRFPMHGRKRVEFDLWKAAVTLWCSDVMNRVEDAGQLRRRLVAARRFRASGRRPVPAPTTSTALHAYLHGFFCAESSFTLDRSHTSLAVHLRSDDRPLLEMIAGGLGIGDLSDHPAYGSSRPSSTWRVARLNEVAELAAWLDPAQMRGRKAAELDVWLRAVAERLDARASGRRARLDGLITEFSRRAGVPAGQSSAGVASP